MEFKFYEDELQIAQVISKAATALGYPTFLVGGFVRDRLINRPTNDIDVVCVGDGYHLGRESQ